MSAELSTPSFPHHRRPRSPLNPDVHVVKPRNGVMPVSTSTVEYVGRPSRASPLSIPTQPRSAGSRLSDRHASGGMSRNPYSPVSKFFVTVIPPSELTDSSPSPNARSPSSYSASHHVRRGTLMPLYPTLGAQLYAISREYGLPSIGGLTIYLCDDGEGNSGPRIGEETWPFIWARYFDEQADVLYQDITSPAPSFHSMGHARRSSSFSNEGRRDERSVSGYQVDETGADQDEYRPDSSALRNRRLPSAQYDSLSRQYMTPSPFRSTRYDQRPYASSPAASAFSASSRLPIVARIEWAVDVSRAPWWPQWLRREAVSQEAGSTVVSPYTNGPRSLTSSAPLAGRSVGRRSMHLSQLRNDNEDPAAPQSPTTVDAKSTTVSAGRQSIRSQQSEAVSARADEHGYMRLTEEEGVYDAVREVRQADKFIPIAGRSSDLNVDSIPTATEEEESYDAQSYAGYSAVINATDDAIRDDSSAGAESEQQDDEQETTDVRAAKTHTFDVHALDEADDTAWQGLRGTQHPSERNFVGVETADQVTGRQRASEPLRGDMVHQWVVKHHSPPMQTNADVSSTIVTGHGDGASEADFGPSDIDEVVGLWAEKATSKAGVPSLSEAVERDADKRSSTPRSQREVGTASQASAASSSKKTHSRHTSNVTASTSKRSGSRPTSDRLTDRSLAEREPVLPQLQANSVSLDETFVEHKIESSTLQSSSTSLQKLSLLSPIALQDGPGTFAGPTADLRDFLPEARQELHVAVADRVVHVGGHPNADPQTLSQHSSLTLETPTMLSPAILSPTHLEPPVLRSPGQMSGSSSASDMSDSLIDMERALALLSPAGYQPTPSIDHRVVAKGEQIPARTKRARVTSGMSASENMERARTLSASVSPSLRFFRANEGGFPPLPAVTSPSDVGTATQVSTSPPPMATLVQRVTAGGTEKDVERVSGATMTPPIAESYGAPPFSRPSSGEMRSSSPSTARINSASQENQDEAWAEPDNAHAGEDILESYDDAADKDFTMRDQWIAAQQQCLPSSPEASNLARGGRDSAQSGLLSHGEAPVATPQYATVGVQAELESLSRGSSSFSLVSGDATSEMNETEEGDEDDDEEDDGEVVVATRRGIRIDPAEDEVEDTPRIGNVQQSFESNVAAPSSDHLAVAPPSVGHEQSSTESPGEENVFNRLLRAGSLTGSASDVFSSGVPSPNLMSNETSLEDNWLHQKRDLTAEPFHSYLLNKNVTEAQERHDLPPRDDSLTTRGEESTNRNSLPSNGDQWSPEGSVYDDDHGELPRVDDVGADEGNEGAVRDFAGDQGAREEEDVASDSDSLHRRRSRMSTLSSHREALESAGGLTPTFLYDRHLENSIADRTSKHSFALSSLSPISAEYSAEVRNGTVPRQASGDSLHRSATSGSIQAHGEKDFLTVDAFGISNAGPAARSPMPTSAELLARNTIVSLAGEPMNFDDTEFHMPSGFEQVHVQSPTRSASSSGVGGVAITRSVTADGGDHRRVVAVLADDRPLRRSMGSISERRSGSDQEGRRASASASAARPIALVLPGPRRGSPRPFAKDGLVNPIRRSVSPHSPRPRFGVLPPSPSLQNNAALLKSGLQNNNSGGGANHIGKYGNASSSYGSPPDPSSVSPNLMPYNGGFSPSLHNPAPRRVGSPLVIDTAKAQSYESEPSALHEDVMSVPVGGAVSYSSPPQPAVQTAATPVFRGKAASATPPSPRGPRAPPFVLASPSTITSAVMQK